ncbi:cell division protein FtsK [Drancourtella sp. An177]|nr:cell division protein FtsK [Drancourtella sp. An177]
MASSTKGTRKSKSAAKKPGTTKSGGTKRKTKAQIQREEIVREEIRILIILAVSVILLISNFGLGGFAGRFIADFMEGIFGQVSYLFPFLLFAGGAFLISNKGNRTAYLKFSAAAVLVVLVCVFLELVNKAGGFIGEGISEVMTPAFGVVGTYVIDIFLMMICLILITQRSMLKVIKSGGQKALASFKEGKLKREERRKERLAKEAAKPKKRREKKVEGVSFDTTLEGRDPEIQEIVVPVKASEEPEEESEKSSVEDIVITRAAQEETSRTDTPLDMDDAAQAVPDLSELEDAGMVEFSPANIKAPKEERGAASLKKGESVEEEILKRAAKPVKKYKAPPMNLLTKGKKGRGDSDSHLRETAMKLQQTLKTFGVNVTVTNVSCGPSVTRYEVQPELGVKVSKIVGLADDLKLNLAASDIRIEAPIPGKAAVGIEVPNKDNSAVLLRDLLESEEFRRAESKISFAVGKDIGGRTVVADIAKMPHLLVAGATGSGKSVCINTLIMSILYEASPDEVKLIMIDPKVVELSVYNGIPHLLIPVVTDPKKAAGALNWAVAEMMKRYQLFAQYNVRDMKGFNEKVDSVKDISTEEERPEKMPQIVIIVDELADLMMVAPGEVEESICRLAQLARAAGIHLVLATQRPSVNVITGLIKANMPSRIAFSVSSGVDSRTIIDMNGAEKLLGKGDMLFYPSGYQKPVRVQGSFVSDKEVQAVVDYLVKNNGNVSYDENVESHMANAASSTVGASADSPGNDRDVYFKDAGYFIIEKDKASIGMLQRVFKIGFNRAARIMDQLYEAGVVGEEEGTKPRKVLMSKEQFDQYIEEHV